MEKSGNLGDKEVREIVSKELERFRHLIEGHEKLLRAIAAL